jgi:hypothetical protein
VEIGLQIGNDTDKSMRKTHPGPSCFSRFEGAGTESLGGLALRNGIRGAALHEPATGAIFPPRRSDWLIPAPPKPSIRSGGQVTGCRDPQGRSHKMRDSGHR